jgi:predicted small metal-binding protein
MKDFHCRDAGMNCNFVAQGNTEKEVLDKAGSHAQQVHKLTVTPELVEKVKGLIHEDSSEAHRRSMAARSS